MFQPTDNYSQIRSAVGDTYFGNMSKRNLEQDLRLAGYALNAVATREQNKTRNEVMQRTGQAPVDSLNSTLSGIGGILDGVKGIMDVNSELNSADSGLSDTISSMVNGGPNLWGGSIELPELDYGIDYSNFTTFLE